jgi:DNA-directed RNA polymerase specialized sigma24 family protein
MNIREKASGQQDGQLTAANFEFLLAKLAPDSTQAGARYEKLRARLIVFFLRRMLPAPEDLADETINRLARRLFEGEEVASIEAYALGIARYVLKEQTVLAAREVISGSILLDNVSDPKHTIGDEAFDQNRKLDAMEQCLALLAEEEVELLTSYYLVDGKGKIGARRLLAETLGVTSAALRNKIFWICDGLRHCIRTRLSYQKRSIRTSPPQR